MELNSDAAFIKRTKQLYKFSLDHIKVIEPAGNQIRGLPTPVARSGHRIVIFKGSIFAFGGYSPRDPDTNEIINDANNRHLFKELWKFNLASRTWTNLETSGTMPRELASHAAVLLENYMLAYGGTGVPFGHSSSNNTHLCNLNTLQWHYLETTGDKPCPLYGQAIALHNEKMYVIGGTTGFQYTISVHCLDIHTKKWKRLDTIKEQYYQPPPRYRHEIAILGDTIFVFGGGTSVSSFGFIKVATFSLTDYTWSQVVTTSATGYPAPRLCHGSVQHETDVYICGGHNGSTIFSDIWKINLIQLQWTKLKVEMPLPLYFHSITLSQEGQIFIFGGVTDTQDEIRTNKIHSMWLKIPALSDICWQAVLMYVPNIAQMDRKKLFQAGVPLKYLEQIDFYVTDKKNKLCCKFASSS